MKKSTACLIFFAFMFLTFEYLIAGNNITVSVKSDINQVRSDDDAINVISPMLYDLKEMHNYKLNSNKDLHGSIIVLLEINTNGNIIKCDLVNNSLKDNDIKNMILLYFKDKAKFNKVSGNKKNSIFKIEYGF